MSKKIRKILIFIFLMVLTIPNVLAIECNYPEAGLTIKYDDDNNKISYSSDFIKSEYYFHNFMFNIGSTSEVTNEIDIDQSLWKEYFGKEACPTGLKICTVTKYTTNTPSGLGLINDMIYDSVNSPLFSSHIDQKFVSKIGKDAWSLFTFNERSLYVFTDEEYQNSDIFKYNEGLNIVFWPEEKYNEWYDRCGGNQEGFGWKIWGFVCGVSGSYSGIALIFDSSNKEMGVVDKTCTTVKYDGPYISFNVNCGLLDNKMIQYFNAANEYKKCDNNACKSTIIRVLNETENNIKSQCSSILQNFDYKMGQKGCIDSCLTIKQVLNEYRKGTDLYDDGSGIKGKCGFSDKLVGFILNIIRWVKYIIPAIVIILSIIDFIKAIASDKDDEMKKAQGRFVNRLIAAALIFIVPLILEFVLDKMGFAEHIKGCGIINF